MPTPVGYLIYTNSPRTALLGNHTIFQIFLENTGRGCTLEHYAILFDIVHGEVELKYITFVFTIPNNVGMDSYKRGSENLLHAMNECHVLPSGENSELFSILTLQYTQLSTKFLIQIRRNSLSSYAVFIPHYVKNAISHLPAETQFLELTTEYFLKQRMTHYNEQAPKRKQITQCRNY
jgi:hypothetical protein